MDIVHHTTFLYYEDDSGVVMATPAHALVNVVQSGDDVEIVLTHGHSSKVLNTTVAEFLESSGRKIRV